MKFLFLVATLIGLSACGGVKLKKTEASPAGDLTSKLALQEIPYIRDDTFLGNPRALLGQVVEIRKKSGVCPSTITGGEVEFSVVPIQDFLEAPDRLSEPAKRSSLIVTQEVAGKVRFLNYLSAELSEKSVFSLLLFDEAVGRVNEQKDWSDAISKWTTAHDDLMKDENVCYLWVVRGFVQKNIIRRKFTKLEGNASGSVYGVNVGGTYYSGEDDYSVDVKYGLSPGILKRPSKSPGAIEAKVDESDMAPTAAELQLFRGIQDIKHRSDR